jgi:hypothetical protein
MNLLRILRLTGRVFPAENLIEVYRSGPSIALTMHDDLGQHVIDLDVLLIVTEN